MHRFGRPSERLPLGAGPVAINITLSVAREGHTEGQRHLNKVSLLWSYLGNGSTTAGAVAGSSPHTLHKSYFKSSESVQQLHV